MNDDVRRFRRRHALSILSDTSRKIKEVNPDLEITCCVLATLDNYYNPENRGYDDWDEVCSCPYFDVFSTTVLNWNMSDSFFRDITKRTVDVAKKYGKESERWIIGYYTRPDDFKRIDEVVEMYEELGVDRIATWTYRGGYGSVLAAKDALELWDNIGRNFIRVQENNKK